MSLLFKCPLCNRRHLGVCPWIDFLKIYANGVARIVEAQATKDNREAANGTGSES